MILQLNPPIQVVTPLGSGDAVGWLDYGNDQDLQWIVFLHDTRICMTLRQPYIRMPENITMGRGRREKEEMFDAQRRAGLLKVFDDLITWLTQKQKPS